MSEPASAAWCERWPTSKNLNDLDERFRNGLVPFIAAIQDAGATIDIEATRRPEQRAWLMHYACLVSGYTDKNGIHHIIEDLTTVPKRADIDIEWTREGAKEMVDTYGIVYPATLDSEHIRGLAVDMKIKFAGAIIVKDARGVPHKITKQEDLWPVGASYGVIKLPKDAPHWSINGH